MSRRTRRRRHRRVTINLILLLFLLTSLLTLYVVVRQAETGRSFVWSDVFKGRTKVLAPVFEQETSVIALQTAGQTVDGQSLDPLKVEVGRVIASRQLTIDGQSQVVYDVSYGHDHLLKGVLESDLRAVETPYQLDQTVALVNGLERGEPDDGHINRVQVTQSGGQLVYTYEAVFPNLGQVTNLTAEDFVWIKELPFKEDHTAAENNAMLQKAIEQAKTHRQSRLLFPKGRFLIGSPTPDKDYIVLASNLELRGQETTLVVEGSARWFGLATGPGPTDGLSNFIMQGLTIEAKDLKKGNQFMIMANHGQNWQIFNNRFTLVHQLSSHVFDLGGVQQASFYGNTFEGYAPELTAETEIGSRSTHNFVSEAIQFDASSSNGEWDGGLLKAIDPNYEKHNPDRLESAQLTVVGNYFIPYYNATGEVVAYGASIGQHSSEVGYVAIYDNVFTSTLSSRFLATVPEADRWVFEPIHLKSKAANDIYGNLIN